MDPIPSILHPIGSSPPAFNLPSIHSPIYYIHTDLARWYLASGFATTRPVHFDLFVTFATWSAFIPSLVLSLIPSTFPTLLALR